MIVSARVISGVWAAIALCAAAAQAADANLERARALFDRQEYAQAQAALSAVARDGLSDAEKKQFELLAESLPKAVAKAAAADNDQRAADMAFQESRWQQAERLYRSVQENAYARAAQRDHAAARIAEIAEKKRLAEAAQPSGPVLLASDQTSPSSTTPPNTKVLTPQPVGSSPPPRTAQPQTVSPQPQVSGASPAPSPAPVSADLTQRGTVVEEMFRRDELLWQRAVAKMNEAIRNADLAVAEARFAEASQFAETAVQIIEAAKGYAQPVSKYEAARATAEQARRRVEDERAAWEITQAGEERAEIATRIEQRRIDIEQQRAEKVEQLFNTAAQLRKEQRMREAAEAIRQVLVLDPSNATARNFLDIYDDFAALYDQKDLEREFDRQMQATLMDTERSKIPWSHDILYPKNWLEILDRRRDVDTGYTADEDSELNSRLEEIQPGIDFDQQPFDQVMDFLVSLNKVNVAIDWENLEEQGIERDKPVSVALSEVSLRTALNEVLAQVGGDVVLAYSISDGLLRIATKEKLDKNKFILVYDIRDLLVEIPRFTNAPQIDLAQQQQGGGAGGGQQVFSQTGGQGDDEGDQGDDENDELVEEILDIIRTTVEPDSWRETSAGDGALRELNGQLIVYNTSDAHQQVRGLLKQLRDTRALMIAVEGRFLTVTSNFLEEIGVDIDFVFNAGNAGFDRAVTNQGAGLFDPITGAAVLVPRNLSRAGVVPAVPAFGGGALPSQTPASPFTNPAFIPQRGGVIPSSDFLSPVALQQGSLGLVDPTAVNTGIPGSISQSPAFAPALNLAGTFLDNLQVDFLIRATQANRRSSVVQAPRLMLFNGQRAWVAVQRTRQFVSSVTASVAEGAVGVQPVIGNVSSGTSLDIEGTISADRKYVTLTVRTGLSDEPQLEDFEVQRASGNSPGIFIRLTDQQSRSIRTTVSIPDGGTVLLGGLKQVGEVEVEAGVPILSKIPILKRAFTNTTMVKDTQTLLILLKAKILIQKEAEEEAFPTLSSAGG